MNAQDKSMAMLHLNGKHSALVSQSKIKIEFIAASPIYPQIKTYDEKFHHLSKYFHHTRAISNCRAI